MLLVVVVVFFLLLEMGSFCASHNSRYSQREKRTNERSIERMNDGAGDRKRITIHAFKMPD